MITAPTDIAGCFAWHDLDLQVQASDPLTGSGNIEGTASASDGRTWATSLAGSGGVRSGAGLVMSVGFVISYTEQYTGNNRFSWTPSGASDAIGCGYYNAATGSGVSSHWYAAVAPGTTNNVTLQSFATGGGTGNPVYTTASATITAGTPYVFRYVVTASSMTLFVTGGIYAAETQIAQATGLTINQVPFFFLQPRGGVATTFSSYAEIAPVDGGPVHGLHDHSGNNNALFRNLVASLYSISTKRNGHVYMARPDNASLIQYLTNVNPANKTHTLTTTSETFYVVFRQKSGLGSGYTLLYDYSTQSSPIDNSSALLGQNGATAGLKANFGTGAAVTSPPVSPVGFDDTWRIATVREDRASGRLALCVDGRKFETTYTPGTLTQRIALFFYQVIGNDLAFIAGYNGAHTEAQRALVEEYLSARYGIGLWQPNVGSLLGVG